MVKEKYCTPDNLTEALHQQDILRYYVQEVIRHYIDKARLLNESQFTFKKSFWLPRQGQGSRIVEKDNGHEKELKGFHFKRGISTQDPIIQDHIITGKPLIPGASLIELGLEAVQRVLKRDVRSLGRIIIQNPGIVEKDLGLEVEVAHEEKRFLIKKEATILCSGEFETVEEEPLPSLELSKYMEDWDIKSTEAQRHKGTESETPHEKNGSFDTFQGNNISILYQALSQRGYHYGPGLQVIEKIWRSDHGFLFQLKKLPREEGQGTFLNSRLLDGVFQTALALEYLEGQFPEDHTLYVPYFIKSFLFSPHMSDPRFICLDKHDIQRQGKDIKAQLRAYDSGGKGVYQIQDMIFKRVSNQFLMPHLHGTSEPGTIPSPETVGMNGNLEQAFLYKPVWVQQPFRNQPDQQATGRDAVLFINEDGAGLAQEASLRYRKIFTVRRGAAFLKNGHNHFTINPGNEQDYLRVLKDINAQGDGSEGQYDIYYLWACEPKTAPILNLQTLRERQERGVRSLFFLAKALTRGSLRGQIKIIAATCNMHVIDPQDTGAGYGFGGLPGLARTVIMESPKLRIRIIDCGTNDLSLPAMTNIILNEGTSSEVTELVAYRQGGRYIQKFNLCFPEELRQGSALKDKGVYLLIGGAGGIGLKVTEMITQKVKARLILVGRSALSPEKRRCLEQLQTYGNEILYIQGDVCNQGHMKKLMEIIKVRYGALNGVIQAGGALEDKLLINKDWESFHRVMAPKVYGTWIINELTRGEPLDFFVVFSSIVSLLGNIGQVDYAAANSFLDAFIHYRAQNNYPGKSKGVNWTLWADGGMGTNDRTKVNFETRGLSPISSHTGLKALEQIIQYDQSCQLAVLGRKIQRN